MSDNPIILANGYRLQWEEAQNCFVLLYPEGMVKLNEAAGEILNQVDGQRNQQQVIEALEAKFPDADLASDVTEFLDVAKTNGWIG